MALTDDAPIKITFFDYKPERESDLFSYLQKEATDPDDNEDEPQKNPVNIYDEPPQAERRPYERWADPPHMLADRHEPFHNSDRVFTESVDVRRGLLRRAFDKFEEAKRQHQQEISNLLNNFSSGDFQTHSALLQSKTKTGAAAPSLAERVKKVTGRF